MSMAGVAVPTADPLETTLRTMLGKPVTLEQRLVSASKKILLQRIEFVPAKKTSACILNELRAKYKPLNATHDDRKLKVADVAARTEQALKHKPSSPDVKSSQVASALRPGTEAREIAMDWASSRRIGAGLQNLGNTCFLNAVLQCLTYTPPLVNYIISKQHSPNCRLSGLCMICELRSHMQNCFDKQQAVVRPLSILKKLKSIAKHMSWGRQEDAHEFLRYIVDAMQRAELSNAHKPDLLARDATGANQIFGGYLRSQVMCLECKNKSITYDPFLDISLDVRNIMNVQKAFEKFVTPELLSKDNAYKCSRCCRKVSAKKSFAVHRPPNILTIQFKRYSVQGGKITRHIGFSELLDLRPYMSERGGAPVRYGLYAVLLHDGYSTSSGHYYCYVCAPNRAWYCMNDGSVRPTSLNHVLQSEAYLLFYKRLNSATEATNTVAPQKQVAVVKPCIPAHTPSTSTIKRAESPERREKTTATPLGLPNISKQFGTLLTNGSAAKTVQSVLIGPQQQPMVFKKGVCAPAVIKCEKVATKGSSQNDKKVSPLQVATGAVVQSKMIRFKEQAKSNSNEPEIKQTICSSSSGIKCTEEVQLDATSESRKEKKRRKLAEALAKAVLNGAENTGGRSNGGVITETSVNGIESFSVSEELSKLSNAKKKKKKKALAKATLIGVETSADKSNDIVIAQTSLNGTESSIAKEPIKLLNKMKKKKKGKLAEVLTNGASNVADQTAGKPKKGVVIHSLVSQCNRIESSEGKEIASEAKKKKKRKRKLSEALINGPIDGSVPLRTDSLELSKNSEVSSLLNVALMETCGSNLEPLKKRKKKNHKLHSLSVDADTAAKVDKNSECSSSMSSTSVETSGSDVESLMKKKKKHKVHLLSLDTDTAAKIGKNSDCSMSSTSMETSGSDVEPRRKKKNKKKNKMRMSVDTPHVDSTSTVVVDPQFVNGGALKPSVIGSTKRVMGNNHNVKTMPQEQIKQSRTCLKRKRRDSGSDGSPEKQNSTLQTNGITAEKKMKREKLLYDLDTRPTVLPADRPSPSKSKKDKKKKRRRKIAITVEKDQTNGTNTQSKIPNGHALECNVSEKKKKKKKHRVREAPKAELVSANDAVLLCHSEVDIAQEVKLDRLHVEPSSSKLLNGHDVACNASEKNKKKKKIRVREEVEAELVPVNDGGLSYHPEVDIAQEEKSSRLHVVSSPLSDPLISPKKNHADVQRWDEVLPSGYRSLGGSSSANGRPRSSWDGRAEERGAADVVRQLERLSHGYGAEVCTWEGERTLLDQEMARARRLEAKRQSIDSYNEELDSGRTKKIKKRRFSEGGGDAEASNPFQREANYRNVQ